MDADDDGETARRRALSPTLDAGTFEPLGARVRIDWGACSHPGTVPSEAPARGGPVEVEHIKVVRDDLVLLCTDGVDEDQIANLLALKA